VVLPTEVGVSFEVVADDPDNGQSDFLLLRLESEGPLVVVCPPAEADRGICGYYLFEQVAVSATEIGQAQVGAQNINALLPPQMFVAFVG
jgi:hypothetical protein